VRCPSTPQVSFDGGTRWQVCLYEVRRILLVTAQAVNGATGGSNEVYISLAFCRLNGIAIATISISLVCAAALPASAGQQQWASQYVSWQPDGHASAIYDIDQVVWIPRSANSSFWTLQWGFLGANSGGYLGLQQEGSAEDQTVRFSIWNATKAKGSHCEPFGGEGVGWTCTLAVRIDPKKFYRLRFWKDVHRWWGAWLIEADSNGVLTEHLVGRIEAPSGAKTPDPASVTNFVEYFGPDVPLCSSVPLSITGFTPPMLNYQGSGAYEGAYSYFGSTKAADNHCTTGNEDNGAIISAKPYDFGFANGVIMFLGGTSADQKLSRKRHPTPSPLPND
jgi:hypothetical protein